MPETIVPVFDPIQECAGLYSHPWNEIENKEEPIEHKEEPIEQDIDRCNSGTILEALGVILVLIIAIIFGSDLIHATHYSATHKHY